MKKKKRNKKISIDISDLFLICGIEVVEGGIFIGKRIKPKE